MYSTFLKPYNPQRDSVHSERSDDFDNLSLFVSGSRRGSHSSYSASTPSSQQEDTPSTEEEEEQHVSHGFEVSALEFDLVFILQFITLRKHTSCICPAPQSCKSSSKYG